LLLISRSKKAATLCLERGDFEGALRSLKEGRSILAGAPDTPEMRREAQALAEIEAYIESGDRKISSVPAAAQQAIPLMLDRVLERGRPPAQDRSGRGWHAEA
jgi:hypothetical protein